MFKGNSQSLLSLRKTLHNLLYFKLFLTFITYRCTCDSCQFFVIICTHIVNKELNWNDRLKLNIRHHLVNSLLGVLQPISEKGKILFSVQYGFFFSPWSYVVFCLLKKESRIHHNICINTLSMETSYSRIPHNFKNAQKYPFWKKYFNTL